MNEGRFPAPFSFVFRDFTYGEQPFGHTKSKASDHEQLILVSTPGKSLRRLRKDTIIWINLIHTQLLQMKRIPQWTTAVNRMYVCTYVHMYICTYVRMYVCTYVRMYVCTYVRMYVCTYVRMYQGCNA